MAGMNSRQRILSALVLVLAFLTFFHVHYCEVHRVPERVKVFQVYVPLVGIEVWTGAYLVLITKSITVTCIQDSIGPEGLGTWMSNVAQHGNVGLGNNVTNRSLCNFVSMLVSCR